jgi:hypothetical protein
MDEKQAFRVNPDKCEMYPACNRNAVVPREPYIIARQHTDGVWGAVESQPTADRARHALNILCEHSPSHTYDVFLSDDVSWLRPQDAKDYDN